MAASDPREDVDVTDESHESKGRRSSPLRRPPPEDPRETVSGFSPVTLTVGLTLMAAGLRFSALTRQSFWYDEAISVELARNGLLDLLSGRVRDLGNPPLYPALLHLWTSLFGHGDASVRALSALFGTATVPVTLALARRIFPAPAAFLGATLLALAPFHLQMAQEARAYTLLSFLGACAGLAVVTAIRDPRRWLPFVGLGVSTGLMALTHYFGFFLALAQALYLLFAHWRDRTLLGRAALAYLLAAVVFSFWMPSLFAQMGVEGNLARSADSWYLHLVATPLVFSVGTSLVWKDSATVPRLIVGALGTLALLIPAGIGIWKTCKFGKTGIAVNRPAWLLLVWLVLPIALPVVVSVLLSPLYNTRYVILASLPLYLFAASALIDLSTRLRGLVGGVIVFAMATATLSYLNRPVKHQWREAAAFVEAVKRPGDALVFDVDYNETAYAHYAGPDTRRIRLVDPPAGEEAGRRVWGAYSAGAATVDVTVQLEHSGRAWLILSDAKPASQERTQAFFQSWKAGPKTELRGITVQLFEKK